MLALGLLMLGPLACLQYVGSPQTRSAQARYASAIDLEARGDLIAAAHMLQRTRRDAPGRYVGLLATLRRSAIGEAALRDARVGIKDLEPAAAPFSRCPASDTGRTTPGRGSDDSVPDQDEAP